MELDLEGERRGLILRNVAREVHNLGGAGRDLVVVERRKDILGIPAVDAAAIAVQHVGVHEMRPGIDLIECTQPAAASDEICAP